MALFQPRPETLETFKRIIDEEIDWGKTNKQYCDFKFGDEVSFEKLDADSIVRFAILCALEDVFGIEQMPDEEINAAKNLDDVLWLIAYKTRETDEVPDFMKKSTVATQRK